MIEDQGWIDLNGYMASGTVNEFRWARAIRDAIRNNALGSVTTYSGTGTGGGTYQLIASDKATIFVDNHDTQRNSGDSLNYTTDSGGKYDLAVIYMLGQPYGRAQLQSGFSWANKDSNMPSASPYDGSGNPIVTTTCSNTSAACGWDFVHAWSTIYPMVKFRSAAAGTAMTVRSTGNGNQLAFSRGSVGFVALNNATSSWSATFATGLSAGTYCNVVHGLLNAAGNGCTSDSVTVDSSGNATVTVPARGGSAISAIAIYTGQKVNSTPTPPLAPTGVTVTAAGTTATLTWTASSGATSYTVYRSTSATSGFATVGSSTTTGLSNSGLTAGTTYYYYVTASNTAGTSPASATVQVTPSLYTSNYSTMYLRGSMNSWGATGMQLVANYTWSASATLTAGTSYQFKYEIGGGTTWSTNWGLSASNTASQASGTLTQNGSFNVYFTPTTTGAHTFTFNDSTRGFTVTGPGGTAPAAPATLSATASGTTINLTWAASSGATSYTVYRSTSASSGFASVGTSTSTGYSNSGLAASTTYYYYVTASNSSGTSAASPTANATTGGTAPAAPATLTASASGTTVSLTWAASSGATSYTVYRSTSAGSGFASVGTSAGTSYSDAGLAVATTYYYYVTASNSAGTSGASPTANATTGGGGTVTTTIRVHFDVGYGNSISIRGSLSPLSWTVGQAATWTTGNIWVWSTTAIASGAAFEYKALRNDSGWSDGANFAGTGGATLDVYPTFNGNFYDVMDAIGTNWTVTGGTSTAKWVQGTLDSSGVAKCTSCSTEAVLTQKTAMSKTGTTVTLGFKYSVTGLTSTEYLKVDVLKGTTWTTVATLTGTAAATNKAIDISAYQSTAMKLRFRAKMSGSTKVVTVDNVTVSVR
ncbi:MAG: fibronectin type III domain-containing protein [Anaeromyxobacter sp.]